MHAEVHSNLAADAHGLCSLNRGQGRQLLQHAAADLAAQALKSGRIAATLVPAILKSQLLKPERKGGLLGLQGQVACVQLQAAVPDNHSRAAAAGCMCPSTP